MLKDRIKLKGRARQLFSGVLLPRIEADLKANKSDSVAEIGEELDIIHHIDEAEEFDDETPSSYEDRTATKNVGDDGPSNRIEKCGPILLSLNEAIEAEQRISDLTHELSQKEINIEKLQRIASNGLPDGGGLRATTWKLLLGYLSPFPDMWAKELNDERQKYTKLKEDLMSSPTSEFTKPKDEIHKEVEGPLRRHEISHEDHPLSVGKSSTWSRFFKHTEIAEQIDRDLLRTRPEMKFFCGESSFSKKNREAMRNILLLFAKLNPAIGYVQGMNDVLAPIFYVFSNDSDVRNIGYVEADSFACFVRLLGDSVDHFCQQLDNSPVGILSTLSRLENILEVNDEQLWRHLKFTSTVKTQYYAFRWITLLLTQEFEMHLVLRIWDALLGNPFGVQDMLLRICCAMLICVKDKLLSGDFTANLKLLQRYPIFDFERILRVAHQLLGDSFSYLNTI